MGDERTSLGAASVQWNDYVGTAAADDADAVVNTRSLYEIAGLDRDQWTIVSIDLRWEAAHQVTVYAFDRNRYRVEPAADLREFGQRAGELPVTAFHLEDPAQAEDFRNEAFKRMSVRLVARALSDQQLAIDEHEHLTRPR
ncbi:MAG: hypothetical protein H0T91_09710 [Propionibacteriaceae bacterium]|nr:hypothetical protein [Propionibacteriaceae bacterium]